MENLYRKLLSCPSCNSELIESDSNLICSKCSNEYPVVDGVPVFLNIGNLSKHEKNQILFFKSEGITSNYTYSLDEWQRSYLDRFNENIVDVSGRVVFDCGSGSGYMAIELAKKGAIVIALDLTLRSCIRLKKITEKMGLSNNVVVVCASAEALPVKSDLVDIFISNAVLEHLPNEDVAISEIERVSCIISELMVCVPIYYRYLNPILLLPNIWHDKVIGHLRRYDEISLRSKFNNYRTARIYYTGHTFKAFCVLINKIYNLIDETLIETIDRKKEHNKYFASNIIVFYKK